jgi:uncharacterized membrane protein
MSSATLTLHADTANWLDRRVCYWGLWSFIMFVSVWDCFLTFIHREWMQTTELNPIGRLLIDLNGGGVTYFLVAKVAGTLLVTSVLAGIFEHYPRRAFAITTPIACFQLGLLMFLSLA